MEYEVFVTNIPPLSEVPHHEFMKMFQKFGPIVKYKIKRNKRTASITYDSKMCQQACILALNQSYTSLDDHVMFVTERFSLNQYKFYTLIRDCKWEEACHQLKIYTYMWEPNLLEAISNKYELIACQHYALFDLINYEIDNLLWGITLTEENALTILKVRKEGWFLRKSAVTQCLRECTPLPDDVIKHIAVGYMY